MEPRLDRYEIIDHDSARPDAERIIFCDGTGGACYRPETDLELSHWRPNHTPAEYRAGTSTEICFRFLDRPRPGCWTAAVNNHVDVDGILSVYVLLHGPHALAHRQVIIQAAEIGDFWGWGEVPAQRVFQGVTRIMSLGQGRAVYEQAFRRIPGLIDGTDPDVNAINKSLEPLRRGVERVEQGQVSRSLLSERLSHYVVPISLAGDDDERASHVPEFNEAIADVGVLFPQVRARWDAERICLVSVERKAGWFHELWFPGYLWADTAGLWQVTGLTYPSGMGNYRLDHPALVGAFEELQRRETAPGSWGFGGTHLAWADELQGKFPLAGRFLDERGGSAASKLSPEFVAKVLKAAIV